MLSDGPPLRTRRRAATARFAKVDVDAEPALAGAYGIKSIPTLLVLRDGQLVARPAGVISAEHLVDALDGIANAPVPSETAAA